MMTAAQRLAHGCLNSQPGLETRTPLGQVFTSPALLSDSRAFDRDRLLSGRGDRERAH